MLKDSKAASGAGTERAKVGGWEMLPAGNRCQIRQGLWAHRREDLAFPPLLSEMGAIEGTVAEQ